MNSWAEGTQAWDLDMDEVSQVPNPSNRWNDFLEPTAPIQRERRKKNKKKKYNPNRHFEMENYVSVRPTPPTSPTSHPGPSTLALRVERVDVVENRREEKNGRVVESRRERRENVVEREEGRRERSTDRRGTIRERGIVRRTDLHPYRSEDCYNCWQFGHTTRHCPRPAVRVYSYNCGRRGIDLSVCPRCSQPHQRYSAREFANEIGRERSEERRSNEVREREVRYRQGEERESRNRSREGGRLVREDERERERRRVREMERELELRRLERERDRREGRMRKAGVEDRRERDRSKMKHRIEIQIPQQLQRRSRTGGEFNPVEEALPLIEALDRVNPDTMDVVLHGVYGQHRRRDSQH